MSSLTPDEKSEKKRRKQIIHVKYPMLDLDGRTDLAKNTKHPLPRKGTCLASVGKC